MATKSSSANSDTGPQLSSSFKNDDELLSLSLTPRLDVVIPVFSPGLSETSENYDEQGIWPELRRAEANRFAYKLKKALDDTGQFGAVRVTPSNTVSADVYILGEIVESNGQDIEFDLNVIDASGRIWLNDNIKHNVKEGFYRNPRNTGKDPYQPAFEKASNKIVAALLKRKPANLDELKKIAQLRFAASFNDAVFVKYLDTNGKYIKLVSMPSDNDPLFERVQSIRVREQLFIDKLQQNYSKFSQTMENSYLAWQQASFTETTLQKEAKTKSILKIVSGIALITLAVTAVVSGTSSGNAAETATIVAGVGGALLLKSGFKSKEEASFHQDALNELGGSLDLEMSSQVLSFDEETVELTGNINEQFQQWRTFMARMYELEATPSTQL